MEKETLKEEAQRIKEEGHREEEWEEECEGCGLSCKPYDEYTPFGCQGSECMEPLDPVYLCKKCFPKAKKRWIEQFKDGCRSGDSQKSRAEMEASEKCGLKWVSEGMGILGTSYFIDGHKYVDKKLYDRISKLNYWGWCMVCGAKRKGGYCSDKKCEKSFNYK